MSGHVGRGAECVVPPTRCRAAEALIRWVVRATLFLCAIISAEPWRQAPPRRARQHRPAPRPQPTRMRLQKTGDWAVSFRNFFN